MNLNLLKHKRSWIVFISDCILTFICLAIAILLRHGFKHQIFNHYYNEDYFLLTTLISYVSSFFFFGLYKGMWRFASTKDLERVIKAVSIGGLFNITLLFLLNRNADIPRTLFVLHPVIMILALGGVRFAYRIFKDNLSTRLLKTQKVLIVGAGNGGIRLAKDMGKNPELASEIIGFVDDDPTKKKRTIDGIPVLGNTNDLLKLTKKYQIDLIVIAIPSAAKKDYQRILADALKTNVKVQTLPKLSAVLLGKSRAMQLREVSPEDLLGRDSVELDMVSITHMLTGKRILVSGAGGSIGSELCRQISKFKPECLILFELSEFLLFEIEMELKSKFPELNLITIVGDVRNISRLDQVFSSYKPQVVLHAAAYKQVPLMERNPFEAINTNVRGTLNVAEISSKYKAERFVMISTDKAVNPTNVMGASKRIAEKVIKQVEAHSNTIFTIVRFGNVLGSNGSVIPHFKKQIAKGGPVTVTHPEITRYFMSIPEACQLVLQSSSMSKAAEIFVLDMGEPVKILDLARQMISIAGYIPDEQIKIVFTGLREGEKLYEELLADDETTVESHHPSIRIGVKSDNEEDFEDKLKSLLKINESTDKSEIHFLIKSLVPEFKSSILSDEELESLH